MSNPQTRDQRDQDKPQQTGARDETFDWTPEDVDDISHVVGGLDDLQAA